LHVYQIQHDSSYSLVAGMMGVNPDCGVQINAPRLVKTDGFRSTKPAATASVRACQLKTAAIARSILCGESGRSF
jgi:hypothetical protein